jgi:hypothetical protein
MNKPLSFSARALPAALVFAAVAALSTGAHADEASKKALAVKLAQLQQKNDGDTLAAQLTDTAVQPMIAKWLQQVQTRVPVDRQKDVSDKLNVELKKFGDGAHQVVQTQAARIAQDALVPVYMSKLSEDELKTIVTYLQTPANAKFETISGDAAQAWVGKIVEGTKTAVQGYAKNFDEAAERIVSAAASAPVAPANALVAPASESAAPANALIAPASAPAAPASEPASSASDAQ